MLVKLTLQVGSTFSFMCPAGLQVSFYLRLVIKHWKYQVPNANIKNWKETVDHLFDDKGGIGSIINTHTHTCTHTDTYEHKDKHAQTCAQTCTQTYKHACTNLKSQNKQSASKTKPMSKKTILLQVFNISFTPSLTGMCLKQS